MSIATVVTMGFGTFGSVNYLPTIGYDIGEIWTPVTSVSNSWSAVSSAINTWTPVTPTSTTWT